jgi:hypothetical protein
MKPLMNRYTNRYGDVHTFTPQEDGTILWEGTFEYSRVGYPNNYLQAYDAYCKKHIEGSYEGPRYTLEEFKQKIHEYDEKERKFVMGSELVKLVVADTTKLDMVDPSGGPYICVGMELLGGIITSIEQFGPGYKLTINKSENRD